MTRRRKPRAQAKPAAPIRTSPAATPPAGKARAPQDSPAGTIAKRLIPFVLVCAGLAAYYTSFGGLFLFDDKPRIVNNPEIRQLWPPWTFMAHTSRPLVQLSLAVNYALGRVDVWGYHAFNVSVHLIAGLTLFGVVRRMLESSKLRPRYGRAAPWLAAATAVVWIVHPLQTESVTYIIQRAESMMGLFFLLTLYCGIRGASSSHHSRLWYFAAIVACALGMGSKEVMVAAPLVMLLYDRTFIAESFTEIVQRRWGFYAGLAATWVLLGALVAVNRVEEQPVFVTNLTPWRYALTQFGVIVHYLRLSVWPQPLVLDYGWQLTDSLSAVLPWALVVLALLVGTALALKRWAWAGFWGAWFFLILAPTSSILPLTDAAFEHRMYLPLAAVAALVVIGGYDALNAGLRQLGVRDGVRRALEGMLVVVVVAALGTATARRNEDYRNELGIWADTVAKRPGNPRALYTFGNVLDRNGKLTDAMQQYTEALRLKPDYVDAHVNLGAALLARGQLDDAIAHFSEALRIKPNSAEAHNNLAAALFSKGRVEDALPHLLEGVRLMPSSARAHYNLGLALAYRGQLEDAIVQYLIALKIDPNDAATHNDLGSALVRQGKLDEAIAHYSAALRINPGNAEARRNLAAAQASQRATK